MSREVEAARDGSVISTERLGEERRRNVSGIRWIESSRRVTYDQLMAKLKSDSHTSTRWYRGRNVPLTVIRRFARDVVERFHPKKIVLFGSHAYGRPHEDSDVDILVVMPARNQLDKAARISQAISPPFALDIIVRTPKNLRWRLAEGDSFLSEIMSRGTILYEEADGGVGAKGRSRSGLRRNLRKKRGPTA